MIDESYSCDIEARRKGRGQEPCTFKVGHIGNEEVVVRAVDKDGIAPIVALMDPTTAREFAAGLLKSADSVDR